MNDEIQTLLNTSFKISLERAANLVLAFIQEPELNRLALEEAIGGTVSRSAIESPALIFKGSMGWYCRNLTGNRDFPKLFMAFEDGEYDIAKVPSAPKADELTYTQNEFTYRGTPDLASVKHMLLNDSHQLTADKKISRDDVNQFANLMPLDSDKRKFNIFPCSFFENRTVGGDIQQFLDLSELVAVRYYFGYDNSEVHRKSNRIRVIFVGVDQDGRNIVGADNQTLVTSRLVQNSWPPPPPPYTEQID